MAAILTPKQEGFCLDYIATGNASEAYRRNYDCSKMKETTVTRNAKTMVDDSKISARIEELRKPIREKACLTLEEHLSTLERLRNKAEEAEQFTAAITAETNRGKASGLYTEKVEQKTTLSGSVSIEHLHPDLQSAIDAVYGFKPQEEAK